MITKNVHWIGIRLLLLLGLALPPFKLSAAPPPIPIVHILATDPGGAEAGPDTAQFTVYRDGPTNTSLTVTYHFGGTAGNGVDYQTLSGTVTIPACASSAPITVTPIDDSLVEGSEYVGIALEQPLIWPPPYIVCWPSFGFAHIEDNDFPPTNRPPFVRIVSPPDGSVFEASSDITIVAYAWDLDGRVRTVEFFAGTHSLGIVTNHPPWPIAEVDHTGGLVHLEEDADVFPELNTDSNADVIPSNPFRIVWENAPPGHHVLTAVATDNQGASTRSEAVEIKVTEPPPQPVVTVRASDPEAAEPDPAGNRLDTATFTVHRTGSTDFPITVFYRLSGTASNGVDYRELPHTVTIPIGSRRADVVVEPIDDNLVEGTEKVVMTILPPICIAIFPPPPDCYRVGRHHVARAAIHDNDTPSNRPPFVQIVRPLDGSVFLAPAEIAIVARARDFDGEVVTVEFFEGTNTLGIVTNNPAALTPTRPPFHLVWSHVPPGHYILTAEATDNVGASSRSRPVEIKVTGRTEPPVVSIEATDPDASEGGTTVTPGGPPNSLINTATFRVRRTGGTDHPLLVYYSLSGTAMNGEDYRELSGKVTIPQNAASAEIVVIPIDDTKVEGPESVVATVEPPICIAIHPPPPDCYIVGSNHVARAVIRDNDVSPTNQPPKAAIIRPENGDVFVAPADITIYAEAKDADGFVKTVEFFANGTSLGVVSNSLSSAEQVEQIFRLHWSNVPAGGYILTAKATDNRGAMTVSDPVRIKVIEPNLPPVVTIHATDPWASEGDLHPSPVLVTEGNGSGVQHIAFIGPPIADIPNNATFTVKRSGGTNVPLVVYYSLSGTAANGLDYRSLSGEVTIPRGAWSANIVVDPIDDNLFEGTETVIAALRHVLCPAIHPPPPECYIVGDPARAIAYIRDNDFNQRPKVEIVHPSDGQVFPAHSDIEINVYARDPDGWVERVEFFAGTNKIGEDFIIFIQPPPPGELQKFSLVWSNVPPGRYVLTAKATDNIGAMSVSEPIEIKVLEPCRIPVVTIVATNRVAREQNPLLDILSDLATFKVSRTCVDNTDLLVYYSISGTASNAVDYQFLRGHVTIPAGSASAEIVIDPIDDNLVEGTESVILRLEPPICIATDPPPPGCYLVGHPARDIAYIRDNDLSPNLPPRVALVNPPDGSVFVAPADILLIASASDTDGWVSTVEFFAGTNSLGIVTNHPLALDPTRLPDLTADIDPAIRPMNPFQLKWPDVPPGHYILTALATDNRGASTKSDPVEIKVTERPDEPIVTVAATDPKASEGGLDPSVDPVPDTATFTVKRTGGTNSPLTIYYRLSGSASNGVDYRELPNAATIPAGSRTADVVVEPIDDNLVEGPEKVVITLVPICLDIFPQSPDCYQVGRARQARAVIYDNDTPPNRPPEVSLIEPQDGETFLAPADIKLVAKAADPDGTIVQVEFFEGTNSIGMATGPSQDHLYRARWIQVPAGHYVLTSVATDNRGETAESEPVEIKVVERTPPPVVTIEATDPVATEQDPRSASPVHDTATFTVKRTGETNRPLVVYLRTGGTASNAVDYEFIRGHVTIPAGASSANIVVDPIDDELCEATESVVIGILPSVCVAEFPPPLDCYVVGTPSRARAVIRDNDICPPNQPPKVAIIRPENGDVFQAPADISICAEAKDADGYVVKVEFFEGTNRIGVAYNEPGHELEIFCVRWPDVRPGSYVLTAVATDNNGASTRSEPIRIKVLDPPTRPIVSIRATDPVGSESGDQAAFTVSRSCCTNIPLTVYYRLSGTASNGVDYQRLHGEVIIPRGAWSARIAVAPIDDNLVEGTETVIATLQPPVCIAIHPPPPDCYIIGHYYRDTAYIRDNDTQPNLPPGVAILFPSEGSVFAAPADIEITAVALDPDGWVTQIEFFEGTNQIGGLAILVGEPPPPGQLQIFTFNWDDVPPGSYVLTAKATDNLGASTVSGPIHITVRGPQEIPVVTIHATDPVASEPNPFATVLPDTATFTVRRSGGLDRPLLVRYSIGGTALNGVDYGRLFGELLMPAGEDSGRIVVNPINDHLVEGTESVVVELDQPTCLGTHPPPAGCYLVGHPGRAVAYIRDNDTYPPRVAIVRPHDGEMFRAKPDIEIDVLARDIDGWVSQVEFFAGTNKIGEDSIIFIQPPPPGQLQKFSLIWSNVPAGRYVLTAKATDNLGAMTRSGPIEIAVVDHDPIPVASIVAIDPFAREGTDNTATFRIRRTGQTNSPLTVHYSIRGTAENGLDYVGIPNSVTIPAGRRAARIVITPIDDRRPERIETVVLRLIPAALYNVGRPGQAAAIIVDNDHPRPPSLRLDDGLFHLCTPDTDGFSYRLEASTDLLNWEPVCYNVVTDGALHFVDPDGPEKPARFYRVIPEVELPEED